MSLKTRLLAGLSALVFIAIASAGWITLQVARVRIDAAEVDRARAMGETAAGVLAGTIGSASLDDQRMRDALSAAERTLEAGGVRGGIGDVRIVDASRRGVSDRPGASGGRPPVDPDPMFAVVLGGGGVRARPGPGGVDVWAPIVREGGGVAGAVRLRVSGSPALAEAMRHSTWLLLALTLVDGGLILLFGTLFLREVIRPLEELSQVAQHVAQGDLDLPPVADSMGELGQLTRSVNHMTAALREQKQRLAESQEQLLSQEKLATVGRLAAGVAHEVGNPLTAILGYLELLLRDEKDPAARDLLARVRAETERIHRIIHELLDYARPTGGALEPVDLHGVVEAAVGLLRPQPRFREVSVANRVPEGLPPVSAGAGRLVQVLLNLLLNAADAMGGRGRVEVTGASLPAARAEACERLELVVSDEGPGVPTTLREQIFDPFFTTKDPGAGTGLGLSVCRSIVQSFGGELSLQPSERGARFRVTLPAWPPRG